MVGRLLWKELRESWLFVLIAFASPMGSGTDQFIRYAGALVSTAVVMLWGIRKGSGRREEGKLPLAHLPTSPLLEKAISILIPLAISVLIGVWVAKHLPIHLGGYEPRSPAIAAAMLRDAQATSIRFGALYLPAAFAGCYLISAAVSTWAGLLAGFVWGVVGLAWMSSLGYIIDRPALPAWNNLLLRIAAGAVLCLALFLHIRKKRLRFAQVASIGLLTVIGFAPLAYDAFVAPDRHEPYDSTISSSDGSMVLVVTDSQDTSLTDKRTGLSVQRRFSGDLLPIGFDRARRAYMVWQRPDSSRADLVRWNGHETKVVAVIPVSGGTVGGYGGYARVGSIRPDGNHAVFALHSTVGDGSDMWIVNLRTGDSWVAFANSYWSLDRVTWLEDKLMFPDGRLISTIDLLTKKTGTLNVPGLDGG